MKLLSKKIRLPFFSKKIIFFLFVTGFLFIIPQNSFATNDCNTGYCFTNISPNPLNENSNLTWPQMYIETCVKDNNGAYLYWSKPSDNSWTPIYWTSGNNVMSGVSGGNCTVGNGIDSTNFTPDNSQQPNIDYSFALFQRPNGASTDGGPISKSQTPLATVTIHFNPPPSCPIAPTLSSPLGNPTVPFDGPAYNINNYYTLSWQNTTFDNYNAVIHDNTADPGGTNLSYTYSFPNTTNNWQDIYVIPTDPPSTPNISTGRILIQGHNYSWWVNGHTSIAGCSDKPSTTTQNNFNIAPYPTNFSSTVIPTSGTLLTTLDDNIVVEDSNGAGNRINSSNPAKPGQTIYFKGFLGYQDTNGNYRPLATQYVNIAGSSVLTDSTGYFSFGYQIPTTTTTNFNAAAIFAGTTTDPMDIGSSSNALTVIVQQPGTTSFNNDFRSDPSGSAFAVNQHISFVGTLLDNNGQGLANKTITIQLTDEDNNNSVQTLTPIAGAAGDVNPTNSGGTFQVTVALPSTILNSTEHYHVNAIFGGYSQYTGSSSSKLSFTVSNNVSYPTRVSISSISDSNPIPGQIIHFIGSIQYNSGGGWLPLAEGAIGDAYVNLMQSGNPTPLVSHVPTNTSAGNFNIPYTIPSSGFPTSFYVTFANQTINVPTLGGNVTYISSDSSASLATISVYTTDKLIYPNPTPDNRPMQRLTQFDFSGNGHSNFNNNFCGVQGGNGSNNVLVNGFPTYVTVDNVEYTQSVYCQIHPPGNIWSVEDDSTARLANTTNSYAGQVITIPSNINQITRITFDSVWVGNLNDSIQEGMIKPAEVRVYQAAAPGGNPVRDPQSDMTPITAVVGSNRLIGKTTVNIPYTNSTAATNVVADFSGNPIQVTAGQQYYFELYSMDDLQSRTSKNGYPKLVLKIPLAKILDNNSIKSYSPSTNGYAVWSGGDATYPYALNSNDIRLTGDSQNASDLADVKVFGNNNGPGGTPVGSGSSSCTSVSAPTQLQVNSIPYSSSINVSPGSSNIFTWDNSSGTTPSYGVRIQDNNDPNWPVNTKPSSCSGLLNGGLSLCQNNVNSGTTFPTFSFITNHTYTYWVSASNSCPSNQDSSGVNIAVPANTQPSKVDITGTVKYQPSAGAALQPVPDGTQITVTDNTTNAQPEKVLTQNGTGIFDDSSNLVNSGDTYSVSAALPPITIAGVQETLRTPPADYTGQVAGSTPDCAANGGCNFTYSLAPLPDLVVGTLLPLKQLVNTTLPINATVQNNDAGTANSFETSLAITSSQTTNPSFANFKTTSSLASNQTTPVYWNWLFPSPIGDYAYKICANAGVPPIAESNSTNDCQSESIKIQSPPIVQTLSPGLTPVTGGFSATFNGNITSNGNALIQNRYFQWYQNTDGTTPCSDNQTNRLVTETNPPSPIPLGLFTIPDTTDIFAPGSYYCVRAYVNTDALTTGLDAYGSWVNFSTPAAAGGTTPTVALGASSELPGSTNYLPTGIGASPLYVPQTSPATSVRLNWQTTNNPDHCTFISYPVDANWNATNVLCSAANQNCGASAITTTNINPIFGINKPNQYSIYCTKAGSPQSNTADAIVNITPSYDLLALSVDKASGTYTPGSQVTFSGIVENKGVSAVNQTILSHFDISQNTNTFVHADVTLPATNITSLVPGDQQTVTSTSPTWTVPACATAPTTPCFHVVRFCTDDGNVLSEDMSNNCTSQLITITSTATSTGEPWIQTQNGSVHTNSNISVP